MSTLAPDSFDYERSRAAVAIACLQWLGCTGPAIEAERTIRHEVAKLPPIVRRDQVSEPDDFPHPLWDRWIDG